jgi:hypothetical protein
MSTGKLFLNSSTSKKLHPRPIGPVPLPIDFEWDKGNIGLPTKLCLFFFPGHGSLHPLGALPFLFFLMLRLPAALTVFKETAVFTLKLSSYYFTTQWAFPALELVKFDIPLLIIMARKGGNSVNEGIDKLLLY